MVLKFLIEWDQVCANPNGGQLIIKTSVDKYKASSLPLAVSQWQANDYPLAAIFSVKQVERFGKIKGGVVDVRQFADAKRGKVRQ